MTLDNYHIMYRNGIFELAIEKGITFRGLLGVHISRLCMDVDTVLMFM